MHLRVLAVNVWNTAGDPRRIDLLNSEISRIAPDLAAFEEVVQSPERNQLEEPIGGIWASDHYGVVVDVDAGMKSAPG